MMLIPASLTCWAVLFSSLTPRRVTPSVTQISIFGMCERSPLATVKALSTSLSPRAASLTLLLPDRKKTETLFTFKIFTIQIKMQNIRTKNYFRKIYAKNDVSHKNRLSVNLLTLRILPSIWQPVLLWLCCTY